jgi:hypothetical protein
LFFGDVRGLGMHIRSWIFEIRNIKGDEELISYMLAAMTVSQEFLTWTIAGLLVV